MASQLGAPPSKVDFKLLGDAYGLSLADGVEFPLLVAMILSPPPPTGNLVKRKRKYRDLTPFLPSDEGTPHQRTPHHRLPSPATPPSGDSTSDHTRRGRLHLRPYLQPAFLLRCKISIKGELEALFLDKIIKDLGLCISVYDIQSIDGGFIFANEGAPTYTVKFRLIIFQPFVGEIISAKLKESNADGIRLSVGFFDDIYIPVFLLPSPITAEPDSENKNQVKWIWKYDGAEYLIDGYDEIRFRVHKVKFPEIPKEQKDSKPFAPMVVIGSLVCEAGLGPISWWV
ncbi:unnamed protein product [Lactuca saligna]|uniref:DNA-directed RNA polymerase subunit n=1 Tax=Lactuca saligna TaxID=75948 RepID=A0AA35Z9A1_LACSI|nr:unnamed protein product [Lactuca saligna]